MSNMKNGRWLVKSYPEDEVNVDNFELVYDEVPEPGEGEVLIQTTSLVMSPPLRMAIGTGGITGNRVKLGAMMRGSGQGVVVKSRHPDFTEGDLVAGAIGWQEYAVTDGERPFPLEKISPKAGQPITANLHVMGASGATAYVGLYDIAKPKVGDVILVSAAAGSVGALVCQLGKISGCRVIAIAGNEKKCRWLKDDLGLSEVINYKTENVAARLREVCPNGVDIYFDNVGGETLDAALTLMNKFGRIPVCGLISMYNDWSSTGPRMYRNILMKTLTVTGFLVSDYAEQFGECLDSLGQWVAEGKIKFKVDVVEGIENAPKAVNKLFSGENNGKLVIQTSKEP